jgi:hypothetical protein
MVEWKKMVASELLVWMKSSIDKGNDKNGGMTAAALLRRCSNINSDVMSGVTEDDIEKFMSDELKLDCRK